MRASLAKTALLKRCTMPPFLDTTGNFRAPRITNPKRACWPDTWRFEEER